MTKLEAMLLPDERVEYSGRLHNMVYVPAAICIPICGLGLVGMLIAWGAQRANQVLVTNRRLIVRHGMGSFVTDDIPLANVMTRYSGDPGKAYGTVVIGGPGIKDITVSFLERPSDLQAAIARARS